MANKPLTPLTDQQIKLIANNVLAACADINKLNKTGYNFLYLASGFIAHYNIDGFKDYYEDPGMLRDDILQHQQQNQWTNFRVGEPYAEYYHSKRDCYNVICERILRAQ